MSKKPTILSLLKDFLTYLKQVIDEVLKANYNERIKLLENEKELLKGNSDELLKRMKTMEEYLGVRYESKSKYIKK